MAPDGEIASFATSSYDDVTHTGVFVLVGTAPSHQRRGLARAVVTEVLRRLRRLGATAANVSSNEPHAHAFYEWVELRAVCLSRAWRKTP